MYKNKHFKHKLMFNYYFLRKPCNYARGNDIHRVSFDFDFTLICLTLGCTVLYSNSMILRSTQTYPSTVQAFNSEPIDIKWQLKRLLFCWFWQLGAAGNRYNVQQAAGFTVQKGGSILSLFATLDRLADMLHPSRFKPSTK